MKKARQTAAFTLEELRRVPQISRHFFAATKPSRPRLPADRAAMHRIALPGGGSAVVARNCPPAVTVALGELEAVVQRMTPEEIDAAARRTREARKR